MTLLLTGGTGLIGKLLGIELARRGHQIIALTRNKKRALLEAPFPANWIECDIETATPSLSAYKIDGVFHLAGENVGEKSWSAAQKERILKSRSEGTKNLREGLKSQNQIQFFIGASAMGYYGFTEGDTVVDESTARGEGFLAEVTEAWEKATHSFESETRLVLFRIGIVLSTEGGALPKMLFPAQIFASSNLGNGKQWMSWIHVTDVVNAFVFAMESSQMRGTFNLVAPHTARQSEMARGIAKGMGALNGPPVPGFVIQMMMGEQGSLALLSLRVSSQKLIQAGFQFSFPELAGALADILKGWEDGAAVKTYRQFFPEPRQKVFKFFSDAQNLEQITPAFLNFHITNMSTPTIEQGTLLDYKLKIHGVPVHWRTRIETWKPETEFTDTQLKGPYNLWHHTHSFEDLAGGTLMTDVIRYRVPLGLMGRLASQALVDKDVDTIFRYRREVIEKFL